MDPRGTTWLLLGTLLAAGPGCVAPTELALPRDPAPEVLTLAEERAQPTSAEVQCQLREQVRGLTLERSLGDPWSTYTAAVGRALSETLPKLCAAALPSRPSRSAEQLWIVAVEADADCALDEGGGRATLTLVLELGLGAQDPRRQRFRASGAVSNDELWSSFGAPVGLELAFARAFSDLQRKVLRALLRLDLPKPGVSEPPPWAETEEPRAPEPVREPARPLVEAPLARREPAPRPPARPEVGAPRPVAPTASRSPAGLQQIDVLLTLGDLDGAERAASALIGRRPDAALAFQRRAAIRLGQGRLDGALADAFRAVELDPRDPLALVTRARVYVRRGQTALALADCEAALALPHDATVADVVRRLREQAAPPR